MNSQEVIHQQSKVSRYLVSGMKELNIKNTAIVATLTIATVMLTTFHYMRNNDAQYGSIRRRTDIRPKNRLEFVHITKTGGSSIEVSAARVGIMWGFCHFHKSELFECLDPDLVGYRTEYPNVLSHGHGDDNIHGAGELYFYSIVFFV